MTETINSIAGMWFDWQWSMLWQSAVLVSLVAVVDRLIRARVWPQLRYMLWLMILVKLILPPGLTSPLSVTSRVPALAHGAMEARVQDRPAPPDPQNSVPAHFEPAAVARETTPNTELRASLPGYAAMVSKQPTRDARQPLSWTVYAMAVWLAGVVVLGLSLHVRLRGLSQKHGGSTPEDVPAWFADLVAKTAAELRLRRVPRVVFTERVCCPAVFGALRPTLLIPTDRLPIMRRETRHILLHELAHIKRGDLLVHGGYMILATIYWINPLLWLIRKRVDNLRELCCDATVAAHLREETGAYRQTLLATGRALLARPVDPGLGLLGLFENSGGLPIRLQWLQRKTWQRPWLRRTSIVAVAGLMLCCILPMASLTAAGEGSPKEVFEAALPGGGTIELIGIRKTGTDRWWRPDGTPLSEAPYDTNGKTNLPDGYEIALRYGNLPEGSAGGVDIERHLWGGTIPMWYAQAQKAGVPVEGVTYVIASPAENAEGTTVKVYLASGEWTDDGANALYSRDSRGWDPETDFSAALNVVAFGAPYEREGTTHATLFYTTDDPHRWDVRLTALDIRSVEHAPAFQNGGWMSGGLASVRPEYDLPLEDIAAFCRQIRPYTHIEFRNVSLRPGKLRKVEIVTIEPARPVIAEIREQAELSEGFGSWRKVSAEILQAFHRACVDYLNQRQTSELPKKPWQLKVRLPQQMVPEGHRQDVYVGYLQYVTHAGYFRPGGFPALERADFESNQANRTPILYCKPLLGRENGEGTNVLYGDGHVEYVTAADLDKLMSLAASSTD